MAPLFWITGPPGAGKTTVARALLTHFEFGYHIPIDELRKWVASGLHESVNWTDETTRQFDLAERGACRLARTYHEAGFAVAVDHCRNFGRLNEVIEAHLGDLEVRRVCLLPSLDENLVRNRTRDTKSFDPTVLTEIIRGMNPGMVVNSDITKWLILDTTFQSVDETVGSILEFDWGKTKLDGPIS